MCNAVRCVGELSEQRRSWKRLTATGDTMGKNYQAWTEDEKKHLEKLRAQGLTFSQISERLRRTRTGCKCQWRIMNMKPWQERAHKERRNARLRQRYHEEGLRVEDRVTVVVPPDVWAERNARLIAPRTISGMILGDPPVGFSALDMRGA